LSRKDFLLILSLIIGFPGFCVALSLPSYRVTGILIIIIGGLIFLFRWIVNLPSWTIIEMHRTIEMQGTKGGSDYAVTTKRTTMRANHKGLTEFLHRHIQSDGTMGKFRFDSVAVPPDKIDVIAGEHMLHEVFSPMGLFQKRTSSLSYELYDSFPSTAEGAGYRPDYHTKLYSIEVSFTKKRPAKNPKAFSGLGAEIKDLSEPELSADGLKLTWKTKNLKPGQYYSIGWDW